jgi:hypothetical protein
MKKLLVPLVTALLAGPNVSHAADEKKSGDPSPTLQPMHVPLERSARSLPEAKPLSAADAKTLKAIGTKVFGVKWGEKTVAVSDRGFQVVTDGVTTLSHRPAGNAYFLQQKGKEHAFEGRGFQGSTGELKARGARLLTGLGIAKREIANLQVLQQFVAAGRTDPASGRMTVETPLSDRRSLLVTRAVEGIPVWTSRLKLDLDEKGGIAALELSWPKIDPKVMAMARRLKKLVVSGFKAPPRAGAKIESVQAGILHSPAAAFVDDQVAAVRVVYASLDPRLGMKPMVYLDAEGKPVPVPRQLDARPDPPTPQRSQKEPTPPR